MRRPKRKLVEVGGIELQHFATGDCLIGGGCGVCVQVSEDPRAVCPRVIQLDAAEATWRAHREAIIDSWVAYLEERGEPALHGLPLFAEVLFDGVALPPVKASWPQAVKDRRREIEANLAALDWWYRQQA